MLPVLEHLAAEAQVSIADTIVLAGGVGVEMALAAAGVENPLVPFAPGRVDATQEQTDSTQFAWLEPVADGFRNYLGRSPLPAEHSLVDRANQLGLTAPEMTALVGGLRALGATWDGSNIGVFTDTPGVLNNQWFVNLLCMCHEWKSTDHAQPVRTFAGFKRSTGEQRWLGSRADLVFASNSELRALAEVFAADDGEARFQETFVAAWVKVMNADRFDLA